jgi:2,5-diketo-D-gluconate reductase A
MPDLAPTVPLIHGGSLPQIGLGTWPLDDAQVEEAVACAVGLGYRSVDTAHAYGNETGVGRGLRRSGVPRDELFVTTKLNAEWHGRERVKEAFAMSAAKLGVDYLDLFLIHWPNPQLDRYVDAWRGLADLLEQGHVRAIGCSNFKPAHIDRLLDATGVVPDVNQIELCPTVTRDGPRRYDAEHGIVTESWSPLGKGGDVLVEPVIVGAAERLGRTPAQVVLRWHVQLGLVAIPKSADPGRLAANLDVFDFELSADEMVAFSALDRGEDSAEDSDAFGH